MKKWFTLLLTVTLMLTMSAPAFAAVTGEFTDKNLEIKQEEVAKEVKMEKNKDSIHDFSAFGSTDQGAEGHRIAYEFNADLKDTILVKQDNNRNPNLTEYITYKMDKNIAGFEFDVLCCAGLGDPLTDLSVFVSKTGAEGSWAQIKTQATYYTYDPSLYLKWEMAYWFHSTLTNAQKIPTGYKYIKIQFNPCNGEGEVTWNVALDSIKIIMGSNVDPVTIPENQKFKTWEVINAERDATKTTQGNSNNTTAPTNNGGGNKTTAPTNNGGGNKTTAPTNNGGGNNSTTLGGNVNTTTSINDKGEVVTDPPTTATNADGEVITDPTDTVTDGSTPEDGTTPDGDTNTENADGNTDTNTDGTAKKGPGALLWILIGVAVLAAAGVVVFLVLKKK